jgi:hypothetical protein
MPIAHRSPDCSVAVSAVPPRLYSRLRWTSPPVNAVSTAFTHPHIKVEQANRTHIPTPSSPYPSRI